MRHGWPLALMLCADQVPIESTHSKMRSPKRALLTPGTTVSALRRRALANSYDCSSCWQLNRRQQLRLLEPLAAHHHDPGHARDFVSKGNGSDLDRPTVHQTSEPEPLRAVLTRISDDRHRAGNEQPAQVSIALLRDPAESFFATGRVLSRHQADPRRETAARREHLPISYLGHQRGGDNRANARDFLEPPAFFT